MCFASFSQARQKENHFIYAEHDGKTSKLMNGKWEDMAQDTTFCGVTVRTSGIILSRDTIIHMSDVLRVTEKGKIILR